MLNDPPHLVRAADIRTDDAHCMRHPLNPNAEIYMTPLSERAGMERTHLWLSRVPPGKESFIFHAHSRQEEFVYILSGRGSAEIGDCQYEVGPGDFMGFPTDGVGHHLRNTGTEDLVYLMGGERVTLEVATFPRVGKRAIFEAGTAMTDSTVTIIESVAATVMSGADWIGARKSEPERD